jgi:hypothetical protein
MKIINSGTPLTGVLDVGSDWLLRLPGTAAFPGSGFTDGFIAARFQLPTALSILQIVTPSAVTEWYTPAQELVDFFPSYGIGESERVTTTLPESIVISSSQDTSNENTGQNGTEVINTVGDGSETQQRNGTGSTTTNSTTTGREESIATPDSSPTLTQERETIQYRPWKTMTTKVQQFDLGNNKWMVARGSSSPSGGVGLGGSQAGPNAQYGIGVGSTGTVNTPDSQSKPPSSPASEPLKGVVVDWISGGPGSAGPSSGQTKWTWIRRLNTESADLQSKFTEPDSEVIDDSKLAIGTKTLDKFTQTGSTGALNPSRTVDSNSTTNSDTNQTSADTADIERNNTEERTSNSTEAGTRQGIISRQGEERRTGGVQTTETERSVPAAVRYGFKLPRLSYDPNTISLAFSYMPVAEVRLTDTSGKVGISCMYSIRVESNPIQGIAPGDRSSPVRLPNLVPFKVTAYMAIRTETDFGKFGSAREEARKISLRAIKATSDQDILLDREMKAEAGSSGVPIGNLKNPGQLGTAALSYVSDLGTRLKTSNFAFPLLNDAYLMINKRGRNLEFMVGSQVLTWEDASVSRTFGVQVIGPTPSYTQSPTPRKSLVYS